MPRYFFHLRDGDFHAPDHTGNAFESLETAELAALTVIDNLRAESPAWLVTLHSPHIEVVDTSGEVLSSLPFPPTQIVLN